MIAGFKGGEVDFATDLQDSDIPKVQDLGDQVSAIPALLYEFLRPNWSEPSTRPRRPVAARTTRRSPTAARAARWRTRRCARRSRFAIDKNEINTRLLGGTVQVANTNISPGAWFFADQPPATFDPAKAKSILDAAGWVARRRRHPGEGRPEGQDRALHDDPPGPPGHPRPDRRLAEGRRHRGRPERGRLRRTSSPTTTRRPRTRRAPSSKSNFDLAEHAFSSLDRPARQLLQLPHQPVRARRRATTPRSRTRTSTRPSTPSRTASTSTVIKDAMADVPEDLRREDGRDPALLPQERRPRQRRSSGTSSRTRPRPVRPGTPSTGSSRLQLSPTPPGSVPDRNRSGRPLSGRPERYLRPAHACATIRASGPARPNHRDPRSSM